MRAPATLQPLAPPANDATPMSKALSRNPTGLDDATRLAVRRAARQSGKSLGDWIDEAIRLQAQVEMGQDRKTDLTASPSSASPAAAPSGLDARVAEISRRLRENRGAPAVASDALKQAQETARHRITAHRSDENTADSAHLSAELRREFAELANAMSALAPREATRKIAELLDLLDDRIDTQRRAGVSEHLLAPAAHIAGQLRRAAVNLDPASAMHEFRAELDHVARRLDMFCGPNSVSSLAVRDLSQQIVAMKEQVSRLSDDTPQFEKFETALLELVRHICALTESGALAQTRHAHEMAALSQSISKLVLAETDRGVDACRSQMATFVAEFDAALDRAGQKNIAEMDARLRALGDSLAQSLGQKLDDGVARGNAGTAALQELTQNLAQKLDAALACPSSGLQVSDLVGRLDAMHAAFTQSVREGSADHQADLAQQIEKLAVKIDRALETQDDDAPLKALEEQINKLAARLDATHGETLKLAESIARQATLKKADDVEKTSALTQEQKETHEALRGVQEWLARIGDRFTTVESAIRQLQEPQRRAPQPAAVPDVVDICPRVEAPASSPVIEVATDGIDVRVTQAGFIAAARRAAQQAMQGQGAQDAATPQGAPGSHRAGVFAAVSAHKRAALITLGAFILFFGAYQLTQNVAPDDAGLMTALQQTNATAQKGAEQTAIVVRPSSSQQAVDSHKPAQHLAGAANLDPAPVGAIASPSHSSLSASVNSAMALATLAANGDASAQFELASRYADGRDIARDPKLAVLWFEKAARQGLAPAQYRLGTLYEKGVGVERNETVAHDLYQRAAEAGNVRAMHNLAVILAEGATGKPDYAAAAVWFRKAADLGVRDSQYNLAILYARGMGVETSLVQSYLWFSAAAAQGDSDAARKRDEVAARLGARDLETAKALAAGYHVKTPASEANDVAAPAGGWRAPAPTPASKPAGKPKVSWFQSFWDVAKEGAAQSDFQTRL